MNKLTLKILAVMAGILAAILIWQFVIPVQSPSWEQPTMGTMAHITLSGPVKKPVLKQLHLDIDATLKQVNRTMSTWQDDTEISMFNRSRSQEAFPASPEFTEVARAALKFSELTDGAFDPTVKPLVDYFGFGPGSAAPSDANETANPDEELTRILQSVGWEKLRASNVSLRKRTPRLQLDLSAIAKGYGADQVAEVIAQVHTNFLVEIGGEIVARGSNPKGGPWTVGIESPDSNRAFGESVFQTLELSDCAMATSGDYRNFQVREDGTHYSHIIDPRTGRPAESDIAAVTVIADRCMDADAVATALFVMGSQTGLEWLNANNDDWFGINPKFEAFFILHGKDGTFTSCASPGFPGQRSNGQGR